MLLASSGWGPGILLNPPSAQGTPTGETRPDVSSAEVESLIHEPQFIIASVNCIYMLSFFFSVHNLKRKGREGEKEKRTSKFQGKDEGWRREGAPEGIAWTDGALSRHGALS